LFNATPVDLLVACVTVPPEPVVYPNLPAAEIKILPAAVISPVEVILTMEVILPVEVVLPVMLSVVAVALPSAGEVKTGLPVQLLKLPLAGVLT